MASIKERGDHYTVIYNYKDENGRRKQKWETYKTKAEAKRRKKEIEYQMKDGGFYVSQCKTLKELLDEYVSLYGKEKWALSTYQHNLSIINNYIVPIIGNTKLCDINTHFMEKYYQKLLETPPVVNHMTGKPKAKYIGPSQIRDVHKLLRSCFERAVKWELMEKNPALYANVPKYKQEKREIWDAETLMHAIECCNDEFLNLSMNLAFACSLRIGEMLAITWDCVDISEEAVRKGEACIQINKELQRVSKEAIRQLDSKDILQVFPERSKRCSTVLVLKLPKTQSSIRKVFVPGSVAQMLAEWKKEQDEVRAVLGEEYHDYGLVMSTSTGMPYSDSNLRKKFSKLIRDNDLPEIVFHSLRHTSVTYKLKLNGGDIKSVQGDSGHAQVSMVTDVYSHIIDEDRKKNARLFEEAFYGKKNLNPQIHEGAEGKTVSVPACVDADVLAKVLANPEMAALLSSLAKAMDNQKQR